MAASTASNSANGDSISPLDDDDSDELLLDVLAKRNGLFAVYDFDNHNSVISRLKATYL
jgi:hypothetical protein